MWNEKRYITTDTTDIIYYKSYREYYEETYAIKLHNLYEISNSLKIVIKIDIMYYRKSIKHSLLNKLN